MKPIHIRVAALLGISVLATGSAVGYVLHDRSKKDVVQTVSFNSISAKPRIVFSNTARGTQYQDLAMVSLADPGGPRAVSDVSCTRVYAAAGRYICLASHLGIVTTYSAGVLDNSLKNILALPLTGSPSRARLSGDGTLAATTSFIAGDSYAGASFSTRTVITKLGSPDSKNLEDFTLLHQGQPITAVDRNFWGVTFAADDQTFYATAQWDKKTWLVRGDLSTRAIVTLHADAECPSLSPDGTHIVFKQRGDLSTGKWRLVSYTIATGKTTPLAETRSIDDQAEWLDNSHVIYGLPRTGSEAAVDDVWSVNSDGTGTPKLLIAQAWSPAVIRS